jgi:hypothetical protein
LGDIEDRAKTPAISNGSKIEVRDTDWPGWASEGYRNGQLGATRCLNHSPNSVNQNPYWGEEKERTEGEETGLLATKRYGAGNSGPKGVHGSGGSSNEACTGIDSRQV